MFFELIRAQMSGIRSPENRNPEYFFPNGHETRNAAKHFWINSDTSRYRHAVSYSFGPMRAFHTSINSSNLVCIVIGRTFSSYKSKNHSPHYNM